MGSFLFYNYKYIQSVEENCTHDHSYYVKNTSVTKNCTLDHSYVKNTSVTNIPVMGFTYDFYASTRSVH